MSDKLPADDRMATDGRLDLLFHFPCHFRNGLGDAANHLALEVFHDFGPPLIPPHGARSDFFAVPEREDIRQIRIRISQRVIVVGMVRGGFIAAGTGPERLDSELIHHIPVSYTHLTLPTIYSV